MGSMYVSKVAILSRNTNARRQQQNINIFLITNKIKKNNNNLYINTIFIYKKTIELIFHDKNMLTLQ